LASRPLVRGVFAAAPAVAVVVYAWTLLEAPASWAAFGVAAVLAVVPCALGETWRVAFALGAALAVVSIAFETWPHTGLDHVWTALHDAPAVRAPFDPASYPTLHGLVVLTAFLLALGASLGVAWNVVPVFGAAVAVGVGFPAVLLQDGHGMRLGVLALAAVLWAACVLNARGASRVGPAVALGAVVVAVSGGLVAAGLAPGAAHVEWRGWDPFGSGGRVADVRYVWDAEYGGIEFPARPTVVLEVRAPRDAQYWRVSTLENFTADRWIENLYPIAIGGPRRRLPPDPLVARRDADPKGWLRQEVTVEGLEEARIAAAGQPASINGPSLGRLSYLSGGVMRAGRPLRRGTEYTVWSYTPRPTPRALASSPASYPDAAGRYLRLGRKQFPGFGAAGREATVDGVFRNELYLDLWDYRPLWQEARRLTANARSPYEATLLLERWFRSEGGFRYEERPPQSTTNEPLVDFVRVTRAGYCQHYAGAMAVMLRMLGIPARVAVGFTAGKWKSGVWTVTDHQAHAWVEAWFAGFGWMTFDPTPGRGLLSAVYTLASDSADAVRALGTGRFLDYTPTIPPASASGTPASAPPESGSNVPWWVWAPLVVALAVAAAIVAAKRVRRSLRLGRRDPRLLAAGVRAELVAALVDRGAAVDPQATTAELREEAQRVLRLPAGALIEALREARYGPPERAATAARQARTQLRQLLGAAEARERPGDRLRTSLSLRSFRPSLTLSAR
jgi:transglutaminase-like putative cysteine protease